MPAQTDEVPHQRDGDSEPIQPVFQSAAILGIQCFDNLANKIRQLDNQDRTKIVTFEKQEGETYLARER